MSVSVTSGGRKYSERYRKSDTDNVNRLVYTQRHTEILCVSENCFDFITHLLDVITVSVVRRKRNH